MKVNTDGVLLGALVQAGIPGSILDVGTGTGVIALMLAQRFPEALVEAIEIDQQSCRTARLNFQNSKYSSRLRVHEGSFQSFSVNFPERKFDLIVSNPPFYTNSLQNPDSQKRLARHAGSDLFEELAAFSAKHVEEKGSCSFILPAKAAQEMAGYGRGFGLVNQSLVNIMSFENRAAHRTMINLSSGSSQINEDAFVIYQSEKVYSEQYRSALYPFLTIF